MDFQAASRIDSVNATNSSRWGSDDFAELRAAALEDVQRPGLKKRMHRRFASGTDIVKAKGQSIGGKLGSDGSSGDLHSSAGASKRSSGGQRAPEDLVRAVMETSGGNNEALARKIQERYERAGVAQASAEVRFQDLSASSVVPAGSGGGLFTVGKDLKIKALKAIGKVTFKKPEMRKMNILQNLTGVLCPGRISLLVGPPGGGKSIFMKALCGSAPVATSGTVTYNGVGLADFNVVRTARYVNQTDLHNPALTVRETLMFSARCQGPGYNRGMLEHLEGKEREQGITPDPDVAALMVGLHREEDPSVAVALTLQLLSLVNCADTIVGDGAMRGISGGEKKRVTSGEIMVGPAKVLFMDEITTGLDSASAYTIVRGLRNWAHATASTITVSLLQPEPQVFDLFDDVILLANGRIIYQGPREDSEGHFGSLGFTRPPRKAVADFLQELVSRKDQPALRSAPEKFEPHLEFVPAAALAAAFQRSPTHAAATARLATPVDLGRTHPAALLRSKYGVAGWDALKALMWRERILLTRNRRSQTYRYIQMSVLAIMVSTLFLRGEVTNTDSIRRAANGLSAMFFSLAYMQFIGLAECAAAMMALPLFYKHRFALFFPPWAYAIPLAIVRTPITLLEVSGWSLLVYWLVGLEATAGRFFTFWGILICVQLYSSALYRLIGSAIRAIVFGTSTAVLAMLLTFIGTGFVLLKGDIPPWWIWMYWLSPLQYALTALFNNEFLGESYQTTEFEEAPPGGGVTLSDAMFDRFSTNQGNKWRWIAPLILLAWYISLTLLNMAAVTFLPPPAQPPPAPPAEEPEYVLSDGSVVRFEEPAQADEAAAPRGRLQDVAQAAGGAPGAEGGIAGGTAQADMQRAVAVGVNLHTGGNGAVKSGHSKGSKGKMIAFPFDPVTLAFQELRYFVPNPAGQGELELLKGVTGIFRPGVLTALMGASGAGKTTLMDVLADRKTAGRSEGRVTVNGFPKDPMTFARVMGYCEQFDVHSSGATVEEAVRTSAALRLGDGVSKEDANAFVEQTLDIVELDVLRGSIVGIPGIFGLSGEQFKRLTIAVELVANPAVIFMDEPTSGLDARAAQIVMRVVRNIGDSGRTIVCTIHQPSTEIFLHFDELLLLKRGGRQIYSGPLGEESRRLVDYFEGVPGTITLKDGYNPATYMLEATAVSEEERIGLDFADLWQERQKPGLLEAVQPHLEPREGVKKLEFTSSYATTRTQQYKELIVRYLRAYWRSPPYNTTRLILAAVAAAIIGSFYWDLGTKQASVADVQNVLGAVFNSVSFCALINFQMIIPRFTMERPVMWRERASHLYAIFPWVEAMEDVEVPWLIAQILIYGIISYWMIGFAATAGGFFFYLLVLFLVSLIYVYTGMMMVCLTANVEMAVTIGGTLSGTWFVFAGFMIPRPQMPPWWLWFSYVTPPAWGMQAIISDQLGGSEQQIAVAYNEQGYDTVGNYINEVYDYDYDFRWQAVAIEVAFVIALRLIVVAATKYLNFQKR